ncbi:IclR family transcriptional regulator [Natronolimnohabitans innermongolicus]|uniref:ArcR family transcription regulator n=1 Tax=Natronolimnohabitans innermongolicus JCM 12255 TaxID=1227499 RepID=L9WLV5_9EURY|nr:IclR family transcriptional regulator [Natronolimnohabitans innermongolicus]ELY50444.1 ArcR family transcription regulator [Natronolimnohabitans innermongolicus JCM 12255]
MSGMKSVQRAFDVIDVLWKLDGAGPTEIANEMDIPRSTAHVYLQTLESTGYVVSTAGTYKLSHAFLSMGSRIQQRNQIYQVSRRAIPDLAEETGEVVTLVIEEAGEAVFLQRESGEKAIELGLYAGLTLPLYSHAAGKTILSQLPSKRVDEIIDTRGLEPVTTETITDRERLREELETIRSDGYAVDWDQQIEGMGTIAVPIVVDDTVEGSIGIACPTERVKNESYRMELVNKLRETNETITIKYRYGT